MIKRQEVLKKYNVSYHSFFMMVMDLPEPIRKSMNLKGKQFFNSKQVKIIKKHFGDFDRYSFKTKNELCSLYGVSAGTFRKMLLEAFGPDHYLLKETKNTKLYTSRHVELIENEIGEA